MELHPFVLAWMIMWFGLATLGCIALVVALLFTKKIVPPLLFPFGMLIFGIVCFEAFKRERSKSKKDLLQIFEAKIER